MIEGVLIEGVDFVGKTTVAHVLSNLLSEKAKPNQVNKCYFARPPIIQFLETQAKSTESMLERDWYYSTALLIDLHLFSGQNTFFVQDRHWLTQVGRNRFFFPDIEFMEPGFIEEHHIPFQHNVLLTSSLEVKLARCKGRPPNSPRDRFLAEHPELHQEYEESLRGLIPANEQWAIIDTSELTPREVAAKILEFLGL